MIEETNTPPSPTRKTRQTFNTPGDAHFLTFSCFQQGPFLKSNRTRRWLLESVDRARNIHEFDLWAYVIMPEHVHLVICPRHAEYDMGTIGASIKRSVTEKAIQYSKTSSKPESAWSVFQDIHQGRAYFRFWQRGGGYDRNLCSAAEVKEKIQYIHNNPVRRNLCAAPEDWEWSSAADYSGTRKGPLSIDFDSLPAF